MPREITVAKAEFIEFKDGQMKSGGKRIAVQFNPETLTVQAVGQQGKRSGATAAPPRAEFGASMSVSLLFDTTRSTEQDRDVQQKARKLYYFMAGQESTNGITQPQVAFVWGQFFFLGVMSSFSETLEYFSPDGTPLRSRVQVSLVRQDAHWTATKPAGL